jgi:hypothetical protein
MPTDAHVSAGAACRAASIFQPRAQESIICEVPRGPHGGSGLKNARITDELDGRKLVTQRDAGIAKLPKGVHGATTWKTFEHVAIEQIAAD